MNGLANFLKQSACAAHNGKQKKDKKKKQTKKAKVELPWHEDPTYSIPLGVGMGGTIGALLGSLAGPSGSKALPIILGTMGGLGGGAGAYLSHQDKVGSVHQGILHSITKGAMGNMPAPDMGDAAMGMSAIPTANDVGGTISGPDFGVAGNLDAFTMPSTM